MGDVTLIAKELLGFSNEKNPTEIEIKKAFNEKVKQSHPDTNNGDGDNELINQLIDAKNTLMKISIPSYSLILSIQELLKGVQLDKLNVMCNNCLGTGYISHDKCHTCDGTGGLYVIHDGLKTKEYCNDCGGTGINDIVCPICENGHKVFDNKINIPKGTMPGIEFTLPNNEAKITIILSKSKNEFNVKYNNIYKTIYVPWTTMILGGKFETKDPCNKKISLNINENTSSGDVVTIRNYGFYSKDGKKGSLNFKILPMIPNLKKLSIPVKLAINLLAKSGL